VRAASTAGSPTNYSCSLHGRSMYTETTGGASWDTLDMAFSDIDSRPPRLHVGASAVDVVLTERAPVPHAFVYTLGLLAIQEEGC
jgi:hypothetical protein